MSKSSNIDKLSCALAEGIASAPFEYEGYLWLKTNQRELAESLDISKSTLKRMLSDGPFRTLTKIVDGSRVQLIRAGTELVPTDHQRLLKRVWQTELQAYNRRLRERFTAQAADLEAQIASLNSKVPASGVIGLSQADLDDDLTTLAKRRDKLLRRAAEADVDAAKEEMVPPKQYGCLRGLVTDWKPEFAPTILRAVVRHWPDFATVVKCHLVEEEGHGATVDELYFDFPSLTVIRRFWTVGIEFWVSLEQQAGKVDVQTSNQMLVLLDVLKAKDALKLSA